MYEPHNAWGHNPERLSVFPEWIFGLKLQQQSVLMLALRGPDGIIKGHRCKEILKHYRGTVLRAAKYGRLLEVGEAADTFMSLEMFKVPEAWAMNCIKPYLDGVDELPLHYHLHFIHAAEILYYHHPEELFRTRWGQFYLACVDAFHMEPEDRPTMDKRLGDWQRAYWESASVPRSSHVSGPVPEGER